MLKTDLLPYDDVADLFIIDPDGFIIRKWNSKQLNNGLMTAEFQVATTTIYSDSEHIKKDFHPS